MCTGGGSSIVTGAFVEFTYPVPDGMITDPTEKEAMINAKIDNLEATNRIFWGDLPADPDTLTKGFQSIWGFIRTNYPAFKGLVKTEDNPNGLDWDKIGEDGYDEVQYVDNYGTFARLLTYMGWTLKEGHTSISTRRIDGANYRTPYRPNVPLFNTGKFSRIGACYGITENEEMVVTHITSEKNPYNLKPGDEIVGFNGIPWKEWIPSLIDSEVPIYGSPASSDEAIHYNLLRSGMANVNLFEKINIKRYGKEDIETLDVVYMPFDLGDFDPCAEYIGDIPGVRRPKTSIFYGKGDVATYGKAKVEDLTIGYTYITECPSGFEEFENSIWDPYKTQWSSEFNKMMIDLKEGTDGIIFDLRYNIGGRNETFYLGLAKLIDITVDKYVFTMLKRKTTNPNILALEPAGSVEAPLKADDQSYKKPIIILTGPDCISACDFLMAFFDLFPEFTIIGKSNNGSFTGVSSSEYDVGGDLVRQYIPSQAGAYFTDKKPEGNEVIDYDLLIRRSFLDEEIWQTKESIATGVDRVRQRAIEIIREAKNNN
jgi:hypothetical protein